METLHLDQIFAGVALTGVRVGGAMTFGPFLGNSAIPAPVKAGLTIAITVLLYPVVGMTQVGPSLLDWVQIVTSEAVIGMLLGLTVQFILDAMSCAGQIAGMQMGFSLVTLFDPQTQADTPVLGIFHQLIALLIFLHLNVHHWLLRGLASSFSYLPPGGGQLQPALGRGILQAAGGIWLVGIQVAAPVIAATMLADIALGFLGKSSPQLPVLLFGLSIKTLLGLGVLIGTLTLWPSMLERQFTAAIQLSEHLLHLAK